MKILWQRNKWKNSPKIKKQKLCKTWMNVRNRTSSNFTMFLTNCVYWKGLWKFKKVRGKMHVDELNINFSAASHVAGRLPLPGKNGTKIRVHFFETLYPYENVKSNKKNFHRWTKKIPAKQHSQIGPDGQNLGWFGCAA